MVEIIESKPITELFALLLQRGYNTTVTSDGEIIDGDNDHCTSLPRIMEDIQACDMCCMYWYKGLSSVGAIAIVIDSQEEELEWVQDYSYRKTEIAEKFLDAIEYIYDEYGDF